MIFYSRYKKFRIENNIDLKDISKRTKIDLKYLQSIEKGKFAELPSVYVKLFFKAYINEIGVDINEALHELDTFLNQVGTSKKLKFVPDNEKSEKISIVKAFDTEKIFNSSVITGLGFFLFVMIISFSLNSTNEVSQKDLENELRITKSDLIEFYSVRSEEILMLKSSNFPVTIRFKSNKENYVHYFDNFSGREFFIFEENMNIQNNTFTVSYDGSTKSLIIANTLDFELIFFSDDYFEDFSEKIPNDFPITIDLESEPNSLVIKKYIPKK